MRLPGGSPGNPYLPKPKPSTYTATISPAAVGQHLLRIREQLANEWKQDLGLLPLCNAELRRHRSAQVTHLSDEEERLQYQITPGSVEGEDSNGSPLRTANFDLLKTAVTHGALWRLQHELTAQPTQKHAAEWLARFVRQHGAAFRGEPLHLGTHHHTPFLRAIAAAGGRGREGGGAQRAAHASHSPPPPPPPPAPATPSLASTPAPVSQVASAAGVPGATSS